MIKADKPAILKYEGFDQIRGSRPSFKLFILQFEDGSGHKYQWAPEWKDLCEAFRWACLTECMNGGGDWFDMAAAGLNVLANILNAFSAQGGNLKLPPETQRKDSREIGILIKRMTDGLASG